VVAALRDGALLVVVVLLAFLLNLRTTLITLLAIPLSLAVTALVFYFFGLGINVMTLGGLAVGLGMLVDDAIVGVENTYRRLRERLAEGSDLLTDRSDVSVLSIVYDATMEVRGAIVISTLIVVVVFAPLFTLAGMEGRLFTPLAIAYLVSIVASTLVALTVTPALAMILLPEAARRIADNGDGMLLRGLKAMATPAVQWEPEIRMGWRSSYSLR
jgi:Cu/Ag efflux pump CusA